VKRPMPSLRCSTRPAGIIRPRDSANNDVSQEDNCKHMHKVNQIALQAATLPKAARARLASRECA